MNTSRMAFGRKKPRDPRFTRAADLDPAVKDPALAEFRKAKAEAVRAQTRAHPTPRAATDGDSPDPLAPRTRVPAKGFKPRPKKLATWMGVALWEDRLVGNGFVIPLTTSVSAEVHESGSVDVERRPTLTRMAVGAILPGTALIPGLAFQKRRSATGASCY